MAGSKGSWAKTQEAMENQGSSTFVRLENDGDKAVVALCGAPYHRDICFNEKTNSYEAWDEAAKAAGRKKTARYAMNAFVTSVKGKELGEMRVLEMNFNTMTTVIGLKDKYGFSKYLFEITRHGAKGDTKTTYQILPDKEITDAQRALFGAPDPKDPDGWVEGTMPLRDLEEATAKEEAGADAAVTDDVKKDGKKSKEKTNGTTAPATAAPAATTVPAAAPANGDGAVLSKEVVAEIIGKLKPLDKDKGIVPFLAKFPYAKKVSEIRVSDEAAARALATQLAAPPGAEDPFA
jgi:hypothetical protein